ncbi:MAG: LamG-like jellyroll fold domain-containing protein [Patescibacteria group bacterium]|jgi:hypothetical protein
MKLKKLKNFFKPKKTAIIAAVLPCLLIAILGSLVYWSVTGQNDKTAFNFALPATYDQPIRITLAGRELLISPLGNVASAKAETDKDNSNIIRYLDAFTNTDIVQTKYANKLKEDIILKQPGHPEIFEYQINVQLYDFIKSESGDFVFYQKGKSGEELYKLFTIPAPFLVDADGIKSSLNDVETFLTGDGRLTLKPSVEWLTKAKYPVILDPTIEISIINVHSHPAQGENWTVEFKTQGAGDLKIIPNDQATIDDDEFVSLSCGTEKRDAQILAGDIIFYPNWSCGETATVIHYTKKAGQHTLRFELGEQIAFAYNQSLPADPVHSKTETLRPNGAGSETAITNQFPASGEHWDKIDETTADDDSTYVMTGGSWQRDLYALPNHASSGRINYVKIYARLKNNLGSASNGKISIRTNGTAYDSSAYPLTTSWANYSNTWATNPQTGKVWTWAEIDALEAGVSLNSASILKGQPILMADGSQKNIEDVKIGDEVMSYNLDLKKAEPDKVVGLGGGSHDDYLVFNGTLKTSLNHVIWTTSGYKPAEEIKVGDWLLNSAGEEVEVRQIEYVKEKVDTYDLTIEKNHNFFVSNYLVHNRDIISGLATQVYVEVGYTPTTQINSPLSGRFKDSSLVGYWSFDGADMSWGSTTAEALDRSGNSNNGNVIGFDSKSTASGISGQALSFDGVDDYVDAGANSITGSNPFTLAAWLKKGGVQPDGYGLAVFIGDASSDQSAWIGWCSTAQHGTANSIGGGFYGTNYGSGITDSDWHYVVQTFAGGSNGAVVLYVDGVPKVNDNMTPNLQNTSVRFGKTNTGTAYSYNGFVDDVRIYNRALSPAEISEQYRAGSARMKVNSPAPAVADTASSLVGYWSFNGADMNWGSTTAESLDRSGNNNNGDVLNFDSKSTASGISGQALSFDGVNDYVSISDNGTVLDFTNTSQYTWSSWIKNASTTSGISCFLSKDFGATGKTAGFNLCLNQTGSTADVVICKGNSSFALDCSSGLGLNIPVNQWNNISITYDGASNWGIYKNGSFRGNVSFAVTSDTLYKYFIGAGVDTISIAGQTPEYFFKGSIDDVRVYNRTLTADEILQLYNFGARRAEVRQ